MWGRLLTQPPELIWIIASNGPSCFAVAKEINEVENREMKGACTLWNGTVRKGKGWLMELHCISLLNLLLLLLNYKLNKSAISRDLFNGLLTIIIKLKINSLSN